MMRTMQAASLVLAMLLAWGARTIIAGDVAAKPADDHHKEVIRPSVADQFGKVITVEGIFVEKGNTYHDQNIVGERYLLKVLAVDGKKLESPVTIEYVVGKERVESGIRYRMRAYETLYTEGVPVGWETEPVQVNYSLYHRLFIKDLAKRQ